jgi:hypothetical protein
LLVQKLVMKNLITSTQKTTSRYCIGWQCAFRHLPDKPKSNKTLLTTRQTVYLDAFSSSINTSFTCTSVTYFLWPSLSLLIKLYGQPKGSQTERKYSPAECVGTERLQLVAILMKKNIYFLCRTSKLGNENAQQKVYKVNQRFLKKIENHCFAIGLHFFYYNFVKIHKTLRVLPAMEVGLIKKIICI